MHRMFVVYDAYRTRNIHGILNYAFLVTRYFTSGTTLTTRKPPFRQLGSKFLSVTSEMLFRQLDDSYESYHSKGPLSTTLLTNSKCLQWDAISPVARLIQDIQVAPLKRPPPYISAHKFLVSLMRCDFARYTTRTSRTTRRGPLSTTLLTNL